MLEDGDTDEELGEDQLPPGLSHQLGQLILGAAHHFNADNPNLDINFFAPVFGGEEDFGMNPGDEDMYLFDSDSDSYMEDGEDSVQQIFTSLGDSHIIRRLSFHKNVENVYRFPRVTSSSDHCYEEIYRLLEELELLCKVWRRRVEHPYTAHIAPHIPPPIPSTESCLREGEDYNSSDYEYDSDEEEDYDRLPPGGVNETLTKKKFCQSAKVFHQIFVSVKKFETFQRYVSKMKKYIFCVIFQLFLDALPPATRYSIPQELWEKIWKFTQNSYFRYKSSVPLSLDTTYYKSGLRSASPSLANLEVERIKDLFGALGDLHMIIFEVLYKNPHLLQPSPMFELEVGGGGDDHCRSVWRAASQGARTAFTKMQHMDLLLVDHMEGVGEVVGDARAGQVDLSVQLDTGCVAITDVSLDLAQSGYHIEPSASVIVSQSICPLVCLLGRYVMEGDRLGLVLVLVEVDTGKVVQTVETGHSLESHLIDVGSHRVRRKGGQGWKRHFCLTQDRVTLLARTVDEDQDKVKVWSYPILGGGTSMKAHPPLIDSVVATKTTNSMLRHSTLSFVYHTSSGVLLVHQSPFSVLSTLSLYSISTGEMLLNMCWNEDVSLLSSTSNTRALLRSSTTSTIMLFSLLSGEVVQTWQEAELNTELGLSGGTMWSGVFDSCQSVNQFVLHTHTLSGYRLVEFNPENEMVRPRSLLSGHIVEGIDGLGPNMCLARGVIFTNTRREMARVEGGVGGIVRCHQVSGYSLAQRAKHSILCMGADRRIEGDTVLNQVSRKWWDEPSTRAEGSWDPEKRPVFMASENKVGVMLEVGTVVRMMDMGLSARCVGEREVEQLLKENGMEEFAMQTKDLAKVETVEGLD